jgi:protein-disulfide isomerase
MKRFFYFISLTLIVFFVVSAGFVGLVSAELEWTFRKQVPLTAAPLDNAVSADGQSLYILSAGEILVYSLTQNKAINTIPIEGEYDRISVSPKGNSLIVTSSAGKSLKIIDLEFRYNIDVSDLPLKGPADAPVTIAVFSDYQWPYCARLEPLLQQVLDKNPDKVNLVIKHFPLNSHKFARRAASVALAAARQGKFWECHAKIFENYRGINEAKVQEIANEIGLDMARLNKDGRDPAIQKLINRDLINGRQSGVRGTPAIFVNGKRLNNRSLAGFQQAIDAELKKM